MTNDRFLKACRREPTDTVPVWFMRQAGRYLPEYREVRSRHSFLEVCKNPELAAQVTLQPVARLGVDAAILFSDILIPVEAMGVPLRFSEGQGPILGHPIQDLADVRSLRVPDPPKDLRFVLDAIALLRRQLDVPLVGFCGLPFTLAVYIVEGGRSQDFSKIRSLMREKPPLYAALMEKLLEATVAYADAQIQAGAQAFQFFDTWAGILTPAQYEAQVLPYTIRAASFLKARKIPRIHFAKDGAKLLPCLRRLPIEVLSIDSTVTLEEAAKIAGPDFTLQGNLDPEILLKSMSAVEAAAKKVLSQGQAASGHIFNLGHGILPQTDPQIAAALVETVHRWGKKS